MKRILAALAAAAAFSGAAFAADDEMKPVMTKLKDGVYQFHMAHYSSLVVITEEGVLVVDPNQEFRAEAMRAEISKLTDQPVVKVLYSHPHFDHSRGGRLFKDEGAEFITHAGCTELLSRDLENRVVQPDVTYEGDAHRIELGGKVVEMRYFGANDGQCNSAIYMPDDKVLMAVDWHLQGFVNMPGRLNTHDYVGSLNTLRRVTAELDFDTVISGHMHESSPEQLAEDLAFNEALFKAVWEGMQAGRTVEELKETVKLPEFSHWHMYEQNLPAHVERMAYSIWHGQ
ncbi:MBL fold metallo-hydrolase [Leisingera sp. ANG-Vp]|uniref:MBL fold metallo-hydrolase n=1 Tax=Leisingera sp. ANG-Vp TaxID=1577896 RepID=UPI0005802D78|nr:MBL fold metallo-hydrolase [Leisingera sp. ANG-Vp]KIC17304.1 metallo-beta-lactamase [Leisingera sp. ANG-Vp]